MAVAFPDTSARLADQLVLTGDAKWRCQQCKGTICSDIAKTPQGHPLRVALCRDGTLAHRMCVEHDTLNPYRESWSSVPLMRPFAAADSDPTLSLEIQRDQLISMYKELEEYDQKLMLAGAQALRKMRLASLHQFVASLTQPVRRNIIITPSGVSSVIMTCISCQLCASKLQDPIALSGCLECLECSRVLDGAESLIKHRIKRCYVAGIGPYLPAPMIPNPEQRDEGLTSSITQVCEACKCTIDVNAPVVCAKYRIEGGGKEMSAVKGTRHFNYHPLCATRILWMYWNITAYTVEEKFDFQLVWMVTGDCYGVERGTIVTRYDGMLWSPDALPKGLSEHVRELAKIHV